MGRSPEATSPRFRAALTGALALIVAGALSACTPTATESEPDQPAAPLTAVVTVHSGEATVTAEGQTVIAAGTRVGAGDAVAATGTDALVELSWSDGAVTRLGAGAEFTIEQPAGALDERGSQTGGLTWNRPAERGGEPYGVRIEGANVTNRGPFFAVDCRADPCRVIAPVAADEVGTITAFRWGDETTTSVASRAATWGELFADPWVQRNADLDAVAGFGPVTDAFRADPALAALTGTYDVTAVGSTLECTGGGCADYALVTPGTTRTFTATFGTDCTRGLPCVPQITTEYGDLTTDERHSRTLDLRLSGAEYTWGFTDTVPLCVWTHTNGLTEPTGTGLNALSWSVRPKAAEMVDGEFVVTALSGTSRAGTAIIDRTDTNRFPGCDHWEVEWAATGTIELTRRVG